MNPGRLDRTITLFSPSHIQQGDGEAVPMYVPYATDLPAEQINPGSRVLATAGNSQETAQRNLFRIRYRSDVRAGHRLVFETRTYQITGWNEDPAHPRRAYLLLAAEETTPTPTHVTQP